MTTQPPFSLHFYQDQITVTRRQGLSLAHYPVDARDLLAALRDLPISSGLPAPQYAVHKLGNRRRSIPL